MKGFFVKPANFVDLGITAPNCKTLVCECRFDSTNFRDSLFPESGIFFPDSIFNSVAKRKAEYLAGRVVASKALAELGYVHYTILSDRNRAPCWPKGLQGSISHNNSRAMCVMRRKPRSAISGIGVDVETTMAEDQAMQIWPNILSENEFNYLNELTLPIAKAITLVFSAKESLFKALYPLIGQYIEFLDSRIINVSVESGAFSLKLEDNSKHLIPDLPYVNGNFIYSENEIVTFVEF